MSLEIVNNVSIESDGRIVETLRGCYFRKAKVNSVEQDDLFIITNQKGYNNFIKIVKKDDKETLLNTIFSNCSSVSDFDEDLVAKVVFLEKTTPRKISTNYIDLNLNLLFESGKYTGIEKVSKDKYIVSICNIFDDKHSFKRNVGYGVIDGKGNEILPCKYSEIYYDITRDAFDTVL